MKSFFIIFFALCSSVAFPQINTERVLSIGRNALYFEDYILSIQYFNMVARVKPYLAEPYYLRAVAKINLEDYKGAEQDCSLALDRNPFLVRAYHCRGVARINLKRYAEAVADFDKGLEFDTENKTLLLCKGVSLLQDNRYNEAVEVLTHTVDLYPKFTDAYLNRGQAYLKNYDTINALADFDKVLEIDKFNPKGYAARGLVFYMQGKYDEANKDYDEAMRIEPNVASYHQNRGLVRYKQDDLKGAKEDFDRVVTLDPNNASAYFNRGLLFMETGELKKAEYDFDRVVEMEPENELAMYNKALVRMKVGDYVIASDIISNLISENEEEPILYFTRAEIKQKQKNRKGAEVDYNTAVLLERRMMEKSVEEQNSEWEQKKSKKENKYKKLVYVSDIENSDQLTYKNEFRGKVQNSNFVIEPEGVYLLSFYPKENEVRKTVMFDNMVSELNGKEVMEPVYLTNSNGQLSKEEAVKRFRSIDEWSEKIVADASDLSYFGRAMDYMLIQDYENAVLDLDKALDLNPKFELAYFCRANARYKRVVYEQSLDDSWMLQDDEKLESDHNLELDLALNDYEKALAVYPDFSFAWFNRGNILLEKKDYRNALASYTKTISLDKDFAEAYFNRGLTYIYLGENDKGLSDLSKAGELGIYVAYNVMKRFGEK